MPRLAANSLATFFGLCLGFFPAGCGKDEPASAPGLATAGDAAAHTLDGKAQGQPKGTGGPKDATAPGTPTLGDPGFLSPTGGEFGLRIKDGLVALTPSGWGEAELWALTHCGCAPGIAGAILEQWTGRQGVLPHALVPAIREGVLNDPQVQLVLGVPGALQDLLGDLFPSDQEFEQEILTKVKERFRNAAPGGGDFSTWPGFAFEPFYPVFSPATDGLSGFLLGEQAYRWAFLFSLGNMWKGEAPLAWGSHLAQTVQTLLALSEWKYMFGLDASSLDGRPYGGLSLRPDVGLKSGLAPFDPRTDPEGAGIFTGQYLVDFDSALGPIDLAVSGRPVWQRSGDEVLLEEQARLWWAAAAAYGRLEPSARSLVQSLYVSSGGPLDEDAHQIGLAFLPGLEAILDGPIIDDETRLIRAMAVLPGASADPAEPADLRALARLARALGAWVMNLGDLSGDALDPALTKRLSDGRGPLERALQLTIQTILIHHIGTDSRITERGGEPASPELAAETLDTLAMVAADVLASPFLDAKVLQVFDAFAREHLLGGSALSPTTILWTRTALSSIERMNPDLGKAEWFARAFSQIDEGIAQWDSGN